MNQFNYINMIINRNKNKKIINNNRIKVENNKIINIDFSILYEMNINIFLNI